MADQDFVPERDMPETFANASERDKRILRAAAARLQLSDEKVPVYLDFNHIDNIETALLLAIDYIEERLTGKQSEYLLERFSAEDGAARDLLKDDTDQLDEAMKVIRKARREHPAEVEAKKRIREERND